MKPGAPPFQMMAGLLTMSSALLGIIWFLFTLLFWGNFHFDSLWHCSVFAATLAHPFLTLAGYVTYLHRQTWKAFGFSLAGSALIGITWLLWSAPSSEGIIH